MGKKYDTNYDYEVVLLMSGGSETLVGGSDKTINKALKNLEEPSLGVKDFVSSLSGHLRLIYAVPFRKPRSCKSLRTGSLPT